MSVRRDHLFANAYRPTAIAQNMHGQPTVHLTPEHTQRFNRMRRSHSEAENLDSQRFKGVVPDDNALRIAQRLGYAEGMNPARYTNTRNNVHMEQLVEKKALKKAVSCLNIDEAQFENLPPINFDESQFLRAEENRRKLKRDKLAAKIDQRKSDLIEKNLRMK